jgi:hypothetical protein
MIWKIRTEMHRMECEKDNGYKQQKELDPTSGSAGRRWPHTMVRIVDGFHERSALGAVLHFTKIGSKLR